ncbi:MAG TPA: tetratricopeptide repeat protein [Terriglobales bacterium]|nr:tetratricopeptide repeat protein [Terriglobales bacterium]
MNAERVGMLNEVLAQNPDDAFARYALALEYANSGETETALAEFARLLETNPNYVPGYQMAAQTLLRAGRTDEARAMLEQGIACAEKSNNAHAQSEMQGMLDELG